MPFLCNSASRFWRPEFVRVIDLAKFISDAGRHRPHRISATVVQAARPSWFKEVHVKDIDSHSVRALLASRALLVKIKRDSRTRCAAFSRTSVRATAIATLNRQRHLTPSCGGIAPTAERTVGPARMIVGELDTQTRN
jgi:hypothetical protein